MFDPMGVFAKQFTPVEGGYLYYPSKNGGGKLVTAEEYHDLLENWREVSGRRGTWKIVGIIILTGLLWTFISSALALPDWSGSVFVAVTVAGMSAWIVWASFAPRRLVRDRQEIGPPRPALQVRRQARALLNWRFIIFALVFSGIGFFGALVSPERDFKEWAWLIGGGAIFGVYVWIAVQKFRDAQDR